MLQATKDFVVEQTPFIIGTAVVIGVCAYLFLAVLADNCPL